MPRWRLTRWCFQRKFPLSFERFALLEDKGFPKSAICSRIQTSRQLLYAGCIHCNSYRWLLGQVLHHRRSPVMRWSPSDCKELHWIYVKSITLKESIHCWSESLCNGKYKQVQIKVLTFQVHCIVYSGWWVQESVGWQVAERENPRRWNCLLLDKQGWPRFWINMKHSNEHLRMGC